MLRKVASKNVVRMKRNSVGKTWSLQRFVLVIIGCTIVFFQARFIYKVSFLEGTIFNQRSSSITTTLPNELNDIAASSTTELPAWIADYIAWHNEMRAKYPGKTLFTDPDAPKLLIRICLGLCGGLNDRLGQLPWDLYLANQTKRVILMNWQRPRALEEFLVPNQFDWRIPQGVEGWGFNDMKVTRTKTRFFEGMPEAAPEPNFWSTQLDEAIERANHGKFKDQNVLVHRILGHLNEHELEVRLEALGETDMIHYTRSFGELFRAFFKPSPPVQKALDQVRSELSLTPGKYTGVHCRVRHPKARQHGQVVHGKNEAYPADKTGLPFNGTNKDFAVGIGTHAIRCAQTLSADSQEPIYFFSDSNDLVQYMVNDLKNLVFLEQKVSIADNKIDIEAGKAVGSARLVAREMSIENAHIDRQKGREPDAYYATFVDLYLAIGARCLTYGIGYYAVFASKLSGIHCKLLYQEEEWGGSERKANVTPVCTEETYADLN